MPTLRWHGPHTHDLPLKHVIDLMLEVKPGAYSVEAANPRHEHEWKIWKETKIAWAKLKALSEGAALASKELWGRP